MPLVLHEKYRPSKHAACEPVKSIKIYSRLVVMSSLWIDALKMAFISS